MRRMALAVWFAFGGNGRGAEATGTIQLESKRLVLMVDPVSGTLQVKDKAGGMEWGRVTEGKGEPRFAIPKQKTGLAALSFEAACPGDASKTVIVKLTLAELARTCRLRWTWPTAQRKWGSGPCWNRLYWIRQRRGWWWPIMPMGICIRWI